MRATGGDSDRNNLDLTEAFIEYSTLPARGFRTRFRAGAFYPPISLRIASPVGRARTPCLHRPSTPGSARKSAPLVLKRISRGSVPSRAIPRTSPWSQASSAGMIRPGQRSHPVASRRGTARRCSSADSDSPVRPVSRREKLMFRRKSMAEPATTSARIGGTRAPDRASAALRQSRRSDAIRGRHGRLCRGTPNSTARVRLEMPADWTLSCRALRGITAITPNGYLKWDYESAFALASWAHREHRLSARFDAFDVRMPSGTGDYPDTPGRRCIAASRMRHGESCWSGCASAATQRSREALGLPFSRLTSSCSSRSSLIQRLPGLRGSLRQRRAGSRLEHEQQILRFDLRARLHQTLRCARRFQPAPPSPSSSPRA